MRMILINLVLKIDMVYGKYKDLPKRTESDNVLRNKAFRIASNPKYHGYERAFNGLQVF